MKQSRLLVVPTDSVLLFKIRFTLVVFTHVLKSNIVSTFKVPTVCVFMLFEADNMYRHRYFDLSLHAGAREAIPSLISHVILN